MNRVVVTIKELLNVLGAHVQKVYGREDGCYIDNLSDVAHVNATTLDWINPSCANKQQVAENSPAHVILVDKEVYYSDVLIARNTVLIVVDNPKNALAIVGNTFFVKRPSGGIHPTAIVSPKAKIGACVYIGAYTVVGEVVIGDNTVIDSHVKLYDNVVLGNNCRIKSGAVIGGEGFGFERDADGNRYRFPQIGGVKIGNDVEIGSNTCIDRGALSDTIIEDYVKVDNLCHIAHNVHIRCNTVVVACAEISGSCEIGDDTWVGPNSCIRDQRSVGSNTMIGIGSVVVKNVGDREVWAGNPAKLFN